MPAMPAWSLLAAAVLVAAMLSIMAARVAGPLGRHTPGVPIIEYRLSARERVLLHRHSLYALGLVLLVGAVTGVIPRGLELVGVLGAFAIVLGLPAVYRLTDAGIAFNRVVFRPWPDFIDLKEGRDGLRLLGRSRLDGFSIVCLDRQRRAELERMARALMRGASEASRRRRRPATRHVSHSSASTSTREQGKGGSAAATERPRMGRAGNATWSNDPGSRSLMWMPLWRR